LAHAERRTPAKIGQSEGRLAVAAECRADEVKQGGVLANGQQLAWQSAQPTGAKLNPTAMI
jgi:hypothetical protein